MADGSAPGEPLLGLLSPSPSPSPSPNPTPQPQPPPPPPQLRPNTPPSTPTQARGALSELALLKFVGLASSLPDTARPPLHVSMLRQVTYLFTLHMCLTPYLLATV